MAKWCIIRRLQSVVGPVLAPQIRVGVDSEWACTVTARTQIAKFVLVMIRILACILTVVLTAMVSLPGVVSFGTDRGVLLGEDLVLPTHFRELLPFLPVSVCDLAPGGEPRGETIREFEIHLSRVSCDFGSEGGPTARVEITDAAGTPQVFLGFDTLSVFEVDSTEERVHSGQVAGFPAVHRFEYGHGRAEVMVNIHDRFLVRLEATGLEGIECLEAVAGQIVSAELVTLAKGSESVDTNPTAPD